jgi:uncharacterized membrane protein YhiD involved in acid resistance
LILVWLENAWIRAWSEVGDERPDVIFIRLMIAAMLGLGVAIIRTFARSEGRPAPGLRTTLLLLTMLTALVTEVIGNNTARAFGLAGVISVIRFRTAVEDTRDSAFVIFAMVVGMAVGAGYLYTSIVGFACVALVTLAITQLTGAPTHKAKLVLRLRGKETSEADIRALLTPMGSTVLLVGAETGRDADAIDFTFRFTPYHSTNLAPLVDSLKAKPGVEKVTWDLQ